MSDFASKRRQQFITESFYNELSPFEANALLRLRAKLDDPAKDDEARSLLWQGICGYAVSHMVMQYTAGQPIEPLRAMLANLIGDYEAYQRALSLYEGVPAIAPLGLDRLDDYELCMQLIGLCYLLHRRDLLPRIAKLEDPGYAGTDALYEELLDYGLEGRFESDKLFHAKPYPRLVEAMYRNSDDESIADLKAYCDAWYPAFKSVPWHDGHLRMTETDGDYYGYWAFEAGAVAYLLDLDDSSITHMVYPKDLVAWARAHKHLSEDAADTAAGGGTTRLRCEAGEFCLRTGHWFTPAQANSRRLFQAGELMPAVGSDYGLTIWQWDERQ